MMKIKAIQIADAINIKACKSLIQSIFLHADSDELFFSPKTGSYIYVLKHGVVCYAAVAEEEQQNFITQISTTCRQLRGGESVCSEVIEVHTEALQDQISFDHITLTTGSPEKLRLVMLNLAQSVALDYFSGISERLLEDTRIHTTYLERKGKLDISGKTLKKYIARILNIKNSVSENLYIFDSPEITWEDEELNNLDRELKKNFDLKDRYRNLHEQLDITKENLDLFKDIMFHSESSRLEWIIIILILVEVVDLFILKFLTS
ncbi:RMD1 family protein [Gangjinia marincola]